MKKVYSVWNVDYDIKVDRGTVLDNTPDELKVVKTGDSIDLKELIANEIEQYIEVDYNDYVKVMVEVHSFESEEI